MGSRLRRHMTFGVILTLKYVDNNDTVSKGFIWFHSKMKLYQVM